MVSMVPPGGTLPVSHPDVLPPAVTHSALSSALFYECMECEIPNSEEMEDGKC